MSLWFTSLVLFSCIASLCMVATKCENVTYNCAYYMADSKVPGFGRGVFAGHDLRDTEIMFDSTTVLVRNVMAMETMLSYYVFTDDNEDYEIFMFGPMLMLNHADNETVDYTFTDEPVTPPRQVQHAPFSTHTSFQAFSLANTSAGFELFTNYGTQWFKDRRIKRNKPTFNSSAYSTDHLEREGRCLTDIYVAESSIPFARKGVFANKSFRRGEVVSVSPVLVLPRHAVEAEAEHSLLLNYCITSPDLSSASESGSGATHANASDVALLPLSQAGMMNHGGEGMVNVVMDWFEWPGDQEESRLHWSAAQLEKAQFAPLDLQYVASRDIAAGEELLLSYGPDWEQAWVRYLDSMIAWHETLNLLESLDTDLDSFGMVPPQFRASVSAPSGMFPATFFADDCLGDIPCESESVAGDNHWHLHGAEEAVAVSRARAFAAEHFAQLPADMMSVDVTERDRDRIDEIIVKEDL